MRHRNGISTLNPRAHLTSKLNISFYILIVSGCKSGCNFWEYIALDKCKWNNLSPRCNSVASSVNFTRQLYLFRSSSVLPQNIMIGSIYCSQLYPKSFFCIIKMFINWSYIYDESYDCNPKWKINAKTNKILNRSLCTLHMIWQYPAVYKIHY